VAEETQATESETSEGVEGGNGGNGAGRKTAMRAAAIAAATGATALAARKAFSHGGGGDEESKPRRPKASKGPGGEESLVTSMLASGWDAAKDSLLPFAEEAAGSAGEYVARSGPEVLRDKLVPRFIRGFEKARKSAGQTAGEAA
jgi:hypothetical protein